MCLNIYQNRCHHPEKAAPPLKSNILIKVLYSNAYNMKCVTALCLLNQEIAVGCPMEKGRQSMLSESDPP